MVARGLSQKWLDIPAADLVEATFVTGALVLQGFDEGLAILLEAEEVAGLKISGKAYFALTRLAVAEERPLDVLALLARTRARGVERTDGLILSAMEAAASVDDWGAVARLYTELSSGPEAAAAQAAALESFGNPSVLEEIRKARGDEVASLAAPASQNELARAMTLAFRAHCERGDAALATELLGRKRARGAALSRQEYGYLTALARRTSRPDLLLALRPADLSKSLEAVVEPRAFALTNRVGVLASALGSVERLLVVGAAALVLAVGGLALSGGLEPPPPADPFEGLGF